MIIATYFGTVTLTFDLLTSKVRRVDYACQFIPKLAYSLSKLGVDNERSKYNPRTMPPLATLSYIHIIITTELNIPASYSVDVYGKAAAD